jgi:Chaperone of endosialidase/Secretion system C-terminal sorting domain
LPVATFTPRGRVGIGTIDPLCQNGTTPVLLTVTGGISANALFVSSDMRFKKDVKTIENALDKIKALRGTTYTYDRENFPNRNFRTGLSYGFIAQEVEKVIPEMAAKSDDGYYAVEYVALIPVLTEAIKEQDQIITEQATRLTELETAHEQLKSEVAALRNDKSASVGYKIFQNVPNPTNGKTDIAYEINQSYNSASINVYDLNGRFVQGFELKDSKGTITVTLDNLTPGMYIYDLLIDGDQKAVKKMTLINRS